MVERTCADQGVPALVSDRSVLERVVVLLGRTEVGRRAQRRSASPALAPAGSEAPHRANAIDGNGAGSPDSGQDLHVIDQGFDHGALSVEVEVGPLFA
jgi:hypothetical protein